MKGTKEFKEQKGITLIALVITIIVMLILVAVTITMAINGGLFENARNAGAQTNAAIIAEQQLANGRLEIGGIWYDSIDAFIKNQPSADQGDGKVATDSKYFKFRLSDSTIVASNTQTRTTLTKTATITGINPEYAPNDSYYNNNYYNNGSSTRPKYIQDGDKKITDIYLPSEVIYKGETYKVTEIYKEAFYGSELTSVVIPEGVTTIGDAAFSGCSKLSKVTIPSTVKEIGSCAFIRCGFTSVFIPSSVEVIGPFAFGDGALKEVHYDGTSLPFGWSKEAISSTVKIHTKN